MAGCANASDMSSIVTFLGGPLLNGSLAPFNEDVGEYRTQIWPLDNPVTILIIARPMQKRKKFREAHISTSGPPWVCV